VKKYSIEFYRYIICHLELQCLSLWGIFFKFRSLQNVLNYNRQSFYVLDRTLPEPEGLIYYAGTETASGHDGYMDGAIEAGLRAADEVRNIIQLW
jgi:Flavin containing amine oxidoreductase